MSEPLPPTSFIAPEVSCLAALFPGYEIESLIATGGMGAVYCANILLDLNAQPKIGDFGLARPHDKQVREGDEIFGSPHYTAPEVTSPPYSVCHRADIFSVGAMLHELLTGGLPAADPRPASSIVRCDPRFDAIIRRATQDLPELRYSSAVEMAAELEAIVTTKTPKAGPVTARMGAPTARMGTSSPQARKWSQAARIHIQGREHQLTSLVTQQVAS